MFENIGWSSGFEVNVPETPPTEIN